MTSLENSVETYRMLYAFLHPNVVLATDLPKPCFHLSCECQPFCCADKMLSCR